MHRSPSRARSARTAPKSGYAIVVSPVLPDDSPMLTHSYRFAGASRRMTSPTYTATVQIVESSGSPDTSRALSCTHLKYLSISYRLAWLKSNLLRSRCSVSAKSASAGGSFNKRPCIDSTKAAMVASARTTTPLTSINGLGGEDFTTRESTPVVGSAYLSCEDQ